ncbi:MAG: single-stranded DNA-binding protein [Bacteroidales bacterium]|nr:single-stranded DNA-binding protein [Bacteroidales bacterium]
MSGINKVILIGRLGKDPETRTFEGGVKKSSFTLATSEYRKDKDGNRIELTEWHNIVCWRNLAEVAEKYLNKGKMIYVEGKLRTRNWEDNGIKHYITEVEASTFTMLESRPAGETAPVATQNANMGNTVPQPAMEEPVSNETDDLPF